MIQNEYVKGYLQSLKSGFPDYHVIETSIQFENEVFVALVKIGAEKRLVLGAESSESLPAGFIGERYNHAPGCLMFCPLSHKNAIALRFFLPFTIPVTIGSKSSFGFGDRLGNAGPAHLRSLMDSDSTFLPILAQQSIRELDRTGRSAEEVMDAASWAVLQAGYRDGFGSDADHLKTPGDIDRMIAAGFTMFTIDPSDYVDNRSQGMDQIQLKQAFGELPWDKLGDRPDKFLDRYTGRTFQLKGDISIKPSENDILRAAVKYGNVLLHTYEMFRYLRDNYSERDTEVELSVDETPHPTTPEEHLVIASELQRIGVELVSLAPRFCGDFEKGIDFKGDIRAFGNEYLLHQAIAAEYGGYKLSIHSGSDKFSVYQAIGKLDVGYVHVKTAGTSYLEALRAIALSDFQLFREIMAFSLKHFDNDRKTYHISADINELKGVDEYSDSELSKLLDDDNARQIFHVTFGSVLTQRPDDGTSPFRDRLIATLSEYEEVYEDCLYNHFRKHIRPFEQ